MVQHFRRGAEVAVTRKVAQDDLVDRRPLEVVGRWAHRGSCDDGRQGGENKDESFHCCYFTSMRVV